MTETDRVEFARRANEATVSSMSATEIAKMDAGRLSDSILGLFVANDDGRLNTYENKQFISAFVGQVVPKSEAGKYVTADGYLSQEGLTRVRNAIFYKAYGSDMLLSRISESLDNDTKKITNALINLAPRTVEISNSIKAGVLYDYDISADITDAVEKFISLKRANQPVDDYLNQILMFDDGLSNEARYLLNVFSEYGSGKTGSVKKIVTYFNEVFNSIEALGDPKQVSLLGNLPQPKKLEILSNAYGRVETGGQEVFRSFIKDKPDKAEKIGQPSKQESGRAKGAETEIGQEALTNVQKLTGKHELLPESKGTSTQSKTVDEIINDIEAFTGVPIRTGRFRQKAHGIYKESGAVIRTRVSNDLPVISHELGHHIDKAFKLTELKTVKAYADKMKNPALNRRILSELEVMGKGTSPKNADMKYLRKEGLAEALRKFLSEPESLNDIVLDYIMDASDAKTRAFLTGLQKDILDIIHLPDAEALKKDISIGERRKARKEVRPSWKDRILTAWIDNYTPVRRLKEAIEAFTGEPLKSDDDFYTMAKIYRGGLEEKFTHDLEFGQTNLKGERVGKPMREILEPIKSNDEYSDFVNYMVARRAADYEDIIYEGDYK